MSLKRTTRRKELTDAQALKLENRELKSDIKKLKARIKQLERREHYYDDKGIYVPEDILPALPLAEVCQECKRADLETIDILGRIFKRCNVCGYRSKVTKAHG